MEGHDYFVKVDPDFITDSFNLYGLKQQFQKYDQALDMILSPETPETEELQNTDFISIYQIAMDLYGLIHSRFILTTKGLQMMKDKFSKSVFGVCPRVQCDRQPVLPIALSEELSIARVKSYCPKCKDIYVPRMRYIDIDGAYFGCSFPHIFLQAFPDFIPKGKPKLYIPKIYGFTVFGKKGSKYRGKYINENNVITNIEEKDEAKKNDENKMKID